MESGLHQTSNVISEDARQEIQNGRTRYFPITPEKLDITKHMVARGVSVSQISANLGLSERTLYRWVSAIEAGSDYNKKPRGPKPKDYIELKSQVETILAADNSLTARGIIEKLPTEYRCSPSSISRVLKNMQYTRKRLRPIVASRNSPEVISERHAYALDLASILDARLVFIDETGFNLHTSPIFGYAPVGETPRVIVPTQRGRNMSLVAAIGLGGLLAYRIVEGAFNAERMAAWCLEDLLPSIGDTGMTFVMDNASFHHSYIVTRALSSGPSTVRFLPPYTPQLNPIEQVFSAIKSRYRSYTPRPTNGTGMRDIIESVLREFKDSDMSNYYMDMRNWIVKARQREPFI